MLASPKYTNLHLRQPSFRVGDLFRCWDDELNRPITGFIINIVRSEGEIYDLMIRWNDPFVAVEYCSEIEAKKRMKLKLWKYKPL